MRFDISTSNPITDLFDDEAKQCQEDDAPFDVCEDCVEALALRSPMYAQYEIRHPNYTGDFYYCLKCLKPLDGDDNTDTGLYLRNEL